MYEMKYHPHQIDMMRGLKDYHLSKHPRKQIIQSIQELAELIKALTKYYKSNTVGLFAVDDVMHSNLLEEIFDVDMMLYQLKDLLIYKNDLNDIYMAIVTAKLEREITRHGVAL